MVFSSLKLLLGAVLLTTTRVHAINFTIINGQIFTPGLAIVDSPQPNTPLGGDTLQIALEVSGDGNMKLPPYPADAAQQIHNITIFLTSYVTGLNLTITNATANTSSVLGDIMLQEPSSTVKHVNWLWPACLVGNGKPTTSDSARGSYNISMHQSFRLANRDFYTIFDLPIQVTNQINNSTSRLPCELLSNPLLDWNVMNASTTTMTPDQYPWTNGSVAQTSSSSSPSGSTTGANGLGAAGSLDVDARWLWLGCGLVLAML